ncbi:MAG: hypothetical protein OXT69_03335 [Candidatus Poribacteria bacterium]|nr:hypothetical protein [Candidatus Poribacteria bacterium]
MKNVKPLPPPHNFRANRAKFALTALFLLLALASVVLMRGHAIVNNRLPEQPGNGEINNQPDLPPYEITLSPPDEWEGWIPTTGVGDSSDTETIIFTASTDATSERGSITFHLSNVTRYQGRYMNDTNWEDHDGVDLYFAEEQKPLPGITWTRSSATAITARWETFLTITEFPVNIICNDHAAYGTIHAELTIPPYKDPKLTDPPIKIPKDDEPAFRFSIGGLSFILWRGNRIADAWERGAAFDYHNTALDRDKPGKRNGVNHGKNTGDGFSVHEEYRGFKIGGTHQRLIPTQKEVMVYSTLNSGSFQYANFHEIGIYMILSDEARSSGVVNFSSRGVPGVNGQYRVRVKVDTLEEVNEKLSEEDEEELKEGTIGVCMQRLKSGSYGNEGVCIIFDGEIRRRYSAEDAAKLLDITIAHEIGHAIGLGDDYMYEGIPSNPPAGEACLMVSYGHESITFESHRGWYLGTEVVDFHTDDLDGDGDKDEHQHWEDHWTTYQLHNNHFTHLDYNGEE